MAGTPAGLRDTAYRLGITTSLSIPLFAGRGTAVAALNLYGRDPEALTSLTAAVWATYDPQHSGGSARPGGLDEGGESLVAGLVGAFAARAQIQQATGAIMATQHRTPEAAYLALRMRAAETGTTLVEAAAAVIDEQQW